jgi:ubiquinone/menaquinone biosynthesis C-methylase UbiE
MSLWSAHQIYDKQNISQCLVKLGELQPKNTLILIDLGRRQLAIDLCRHMTTGRVIVIDVYNPQMTPSRELARARRQAKRPDPDPRLSWRDGKISLLPLADGSVPAVTLSEVASEFWQLGDRQQLFKEVFRVLRPGGCILLAERLRTPINLLVNGPAGLRLSPIAYWENLLLEAGFKIEKTVSLNDLICRNGPRLGELGKGKLVGFHLDNNCDGSCQDLGYGTQPLRRSVHRRPKSPNFLPPHSNGGD